MQYTDLHHSGVLGMRWGHRKTYDSNPATIKSNTTEFAKESNKQIKTNTDGSKTIPSGFIFNRVGQAQLDVNQSGALYVSHGKDDAARYVKSLGPTLIGKLLGTAGTTVQHISTKSDLKMSSDSETAKEAAKLLLTNKNLFDSYNKSLYSTVVSGDFEKDVTVSDVTKALNNPSGKEGQKLAYSVSSFLGDPNYTNESKTVYEHFRKKGYDVIPDLHDRLSGTSKTAMIVINPDKLKITSTTRITKDILKSGKDYVKSLDKLKVSDLIK